MSQTEIKKDSSSADLQYEKMVNTSVSKLIAKLAVPTVISMLVTSIYNMADTFFVSQINTQASAAVVGSLMMRRTLSPAISPATCVARR